MASLYYNFIKTQYLMGKIDAAKVQSYVPSRITQAEADEIIALKA